MNLDKSSPVLVTGATGYVAGWIVKYLLEKGLTVHAAVRDPENKEKLKYLDSVSRGLSGTLKYFKADLLEDGTYKEAMEGCSVVFHTASPFSLDIKDPQSELIDPAKQGTQNVLNQANKTASVKRVVLTSSVAAMYGDNKDLTELENETLTEKCWNGSSSLDHNPYAYSKTLAEKEAWEIYKKQNSWDLTVINPSLVMGPGVSPFGSSESYKIIKQLGDGTMKGGLPKWGLGAVDVRDVAHAHLAAAFNEKASGRYIVSGHNTSFMGLADALRVKFGKHYPIPSKFLPTFLVWLLGPLANKAMTRKSISRNAGFGWKADNSKSIKELGVKYRPLEETMTDFFEQLIESKQL